MSGYLGGGWEHRPLTLLKVARLDAGMLQADVARHVGIGTSTFCGIENGKQRTLAGIARKIAAYLKVDPEIIFVEHGGKSRAIEAVGDLNHHLEQRKCWKAEAKQ